MEKSCTNNIVILGDYNAPVISGFEAELIQMCYILVVLLDNLNLSMRIRINHPCQ